MTALGEIRAFHVPRRLVTQAMLHLRDVGRRGCEGFALWAGMQSESVFEVTNTIIPLQQAIRTKSGVCVTIPSDELHRINVWLYEKQLVLGAQIHSHPTDAYHSDLDDELPIATAIGSLSVVIPDFAREPFSLDAAAVYRLSPTGAWTELSGDEAKGLIRIIP